MDLKKPTLHIIMEIKSRELEGRTLLALEAATRGFQVIIGHKSDVIEGIKKGILPSGIYFEKSLSRGKETKLLNALKTNNILVSQDEEGGLLDRTFDRFLTIRSSPETVDMADAIFCWGNHDFEAWQRHYPDSSHKIFITGSPRVDYWRQDFKAYFKRKIDSIKYEYKNFILVSSNFASANSYLNLEEQIAQGKRNGSISTAEDELIFKNKAIANRQMFFKFVELINYIAEKHQDTCFVVRPHPAEKISGWESNIKNTKNIQVVFEGGISSWVHASTAVLHNGCTTGIEAYVSGVPAIAYVPFESLANREIPNKLSIECNTKNDVSKVLSCILRGECLNDHRTLENNHLIRNRFVNVDNTTAVESIVDTLKTFDVPLAMPIKIGITGKIIGVRKKTHLFLRTLFGAETKPMRKFPSLQLRELEQIQNDLCAVNEKYKHCMIKHLYGDAYLIE